MRRDEFDIPSLLGKRVKLIFESDPETKRVSVRVGQCCVANGFFIGVWERDGGNRVTVVPLRRISRIEVLEEGVEETRP